MGNPLQIVYGFFDTGSSLSWFKCNQPTEKAGFYYFNQTQSASYRIVRCSDQQKCNTKKQYIKGCDKTDGCIFDITYSGGDWATGYLCANNNEYSLPRQLNADDPKFSYCISSDLSQINVLLFGPESRIQGQPVKMFRNFNNDNYFIELLAITVNNERLDVPPSVFQMSDSGTRGFIIDSGTTSTWLTSVAFEAMKKKMVQLFGPPVQYKYFEICYESRKFVDGRPPVIRFEFENYLLEIEESNIWYKIPSSTLQCLIILNRQNNTISILGNQPLLDFNVGYDPNKGLLHFDKIKCPTPF
ncbi:aspartyl protease family protein At5g10770-like [Chenopodium quinoa]|uniref:aspartyl protease family protein At5g10770-like n=1 Tax=Chenopodium quinoa TaxID=63459 RepID=UPI000B782C85|nr:aspartyl protease family protein At5g10770-like [Chenopodium quinoa]